MGLLRSEAMRFGMLVIPAQGARRYVDEIGRQTNIQFEDMNAREMRRPYRKHIQRIDEMERILRFVTEEINKLEGCEVIKNRVDEFLSGDDTYKLDTVETELQQLYKQFMEFKDNNTLLMSERSQAVEEAEVVGTALKMFQEAGFAPQPYVAAEESFEASARRPLVADDFAGGRLGCVAGVVLKYDELRFARALWRASRGNTFTQFCSIDEPIHDPKTGQMVEKSVFVAYFQGGSASAAMHQKVMKVCTAFQVNIYNWPANMMEATSRNVVLQQTLLEKASALQAFKDYMKGEAKVLLAPPDGRPETNSRIEEWRLFCAKEKSIYSILNLCSGDIALRVNVWYPEADEEKIKVLLNRVNLNTGLTAFLTPDSGTTKSTPPTYIRTNEFTEAWQEVIDTYGIPKYQEANPALLTVVTFPFIFGMMYGDIGHGSLLLMAGAWLCWKADSDPTFRFAQPALFSARFVVLSMGIFATFAGFMYNDFFSVGLQLFPSGFEDRHGHGNYEPVYDVKNQGGRGPYPFGLDWAWHGASNELLFVNSLKMKLSVLFGVLQMIVGVILRWSNAIHFRSTIDLVCECLPMMVFMLCFFGWMDFMILYKWVHPINDPPSIINSLICMAMGQQDFNPLWDGSVELAQTLMMYTVLAVPVMLFPKPLILLFLHNRNAKPAGHEILVDEEAGSPARQLHAHGEEFEFGEVFIHQIIETIEYVLGTVSHTASYLRIWALSLAHQQLSLVFFQKTLTMGLEMSFPANGIMLYFMFAAWFGVTLGVLLGMDVLECFLHTLRLHWVEFQSKFYKADGEKFAPYNIRKLIETKNEDQ